MSRGLQDKNDVDLLEWEATEMVGGLGHLCYEERPRAVLGQPGEGASWLFNTHGDRLSSKACFDRARGNGFKLKERRFGLDGRKKSVTVRVVRLPREVGVAPSLEGFPPK